MNHIYEVRGKSGNHSTMLLINASDVDVACEEYKRVTGRDACEISVGGDSELDDMFKEYKDLMTDFKDEIKSLTCHTSNDFKAWEAKIKSETCQPSKEMLDKLDALSYDALVMLPVKQEYDQSVNTFPYSVVLLLILLKMLRGD